MDAPSWDRENVLLTLRMVPKHRLIEMLLNGDEFTDYLVREFSLLARFTPVLNEITATA